MSDPLFCDYQQCNLDVHSYARLLQRAAQGHVLWEPSSVGAVGDCGQIRDGQFWKYFNVYEDPPSGVPRLTLENPERDIRATAIDNQDVLRSAETISVSIQGGLPFTVPPASLSINGTFSWDRAEFAFLVFGGRARLSEKLSPLKLEELQRYLVHYEKQIRLALGAPSGDIIILHGVTRAPAWLGGVARRTSFEVKSALTLDVGGINFEWGASVGQNRGTSRTMPLATGGSCAVTRGPVGWDGTPGTDVLSTVVVRPIRVKRRQRILCYIAGLLKSPAGHEGDTQGLTTAMASLQVAERPGRLPTAGPTADDADLQMDRDSSVSSNPSDSGPEMEGDLLDTIMQGFLDANPSVDVVSGSWDLITNFILLHGDALLDSLDIEVKYEDDARDIASIVSLSPRISNRPEPTPEIHEVKIHWAKRSLPSPPLSSGGYESDLGDHNDAFQSRSPPPPVDHQSEQVKQHMEIESKRICDLINQELADEQRRRAQRPELKLLLLGQANSGKSTLIKQFQLCYAPDELNIQRSSWRPAVYSNLVKAISAILDALSVADCTDGQLDALRKTLVPLTELDTALAVRLPHGTRVPTSLPGSSVTIAAEQRAALLIATHKDDIHALWNHPSVQALPQKRLQLEDTASYFLQSVERIASPDYVPSIDDLLHVRLQTSGVSEHRLEASLMGKTVTICLYDVCGGREHRPKWVPYFDTSHAILFLAPISAYDEYLDEERLKNRIEDSLQLWKDVCENGLLQGTIMVLLLNKTDILKAKLAAGIMVKEHIAAFGDRPNEFPEVSQYFRAQFKEEHRRARTGRRDLYVHLTNMVDTKQTQMTIPNITELIAYQSLAGMRLV